MQGTQAQMQKSSFDITVLEQCVQQIQQAESQCTTDLVVVRGELEGLHMKISTLTK